MMLKVFTIKVNDEISDQLFQFMLKQVSSDRQNKASRFNKRIDAIRCIVGELLIRKVVMNKFGISNSSIIFSTNSYGKPLLLKPLQNFNISHSGDWVVCAISNNPVGIDVEKIEDMDLKLVQYFFNELELLQLYALPDHSRIDRFYSLWTAKESYVKSVGHGLSIPFNSFNVLFNNDTQKFTLDLPNRHELYSIKHVFIDDNHKLAVCNKGEISQIEIINMTLEKLLTN